MADKASIVLGPIEPKPQVPVEAPATKITQAYFSSKEECTNHFAIVNEATRRVYCQVCNVELDPIQVLARIARDYMAWETIHSDRRRMEREAETQQKANAVLRAERSRLSARVKELTAIANGLEARTGDR